MRLSYSITLHDDWGWFVCRGRRHRRERREYTRVLVALNLVYDMSRSSVASFCDGPERMLTMQRPLTSKHSFTL